MNKHELSAQSTSDCSAGGSSLSLTLNGVVFLHLRLVVVVQAVHRLSLHVFRWPLCASTVVHIFFSFSSVTWRSGTMEGGP